MLGRRFLLLVAVLMGLTALAASVAPRQPVVSERRSAEPSATPYAAPAASPTVRTVRRTLSTAQGRRRVTVTEGQLVQLDVSGPELDSVMLLDEVVPMAPEAAAHFELLADTPGRYPIELVDAERRIGTLVVRSASG
jgi:hypothetical protein